MESLDLIDVASEDDLLIPDDGDDLQPSEYQASQKVSFFLEPERVLEGENSVKVSKQMEQEPAMSESPELKRAKSGTINLRKSLAWDKAFFTNEGVLENEELAIVNSSFRKVESCKLAGIQEDVRKSSESTSTLNSETYALDNLEEGLFGNVRASIQMSRGKSDKISSVVSDVRKVSLTNKMKPPVYSKKVDASKQRQLTSKGSESGVKVGSGQSKQPLPRLPRLVPKPMSTVSSPKASSTIAQPKGTRIIRQSAAAPNITNGNPRGMLSRPNSSSKPSPASRPGTLASSTSNLDISRKRPALRAGDRSLPASTTKTLSSTLRTKLSNLGPSSTRSSPRTSIDSAVSETSSTASNMTKYSVCSTSSSLSSIPSLGKMSPGTLPQTQHVVSKPSGLRMPTPNVGYFNGEQKQNRSPSKSTQTNLRRSLVKSKIGSNIAGPKKTNSPKQVPAKICPETKEDIHSVRKSEKENLLPANEAIVADRSDAEILGDKLSSLSILET